jgi:hypothetical protein
MRLVKNIENDKRPQKKHGAGENQYRFQQSPEHTKEGATIDSN